MTPTTTRIVLTLVSAGIAIVAVQPFAVAAQPFLMFLAGGLVGKAHTKMPGQK